MAIRIRLAIFLICLTVSGFCNVHPILYVTKYPNFLIGCETDQYYGYTAGDQFVFTDTLVRSLVLNETHFVEEEVHTYRIEITAVAENVENYTIRISALITNLSAGLDVIYETTVIEGYSPIWAGPSVYFTHTDWDSHVIDFHYAANDFIEYTQMSGYSYYDTEIRYFFWNFTKPIDAETSLYDLDEDGQNDPYDIVTTYSALFDQRGVLSNRDFFEEMRFENGNLYTRHRQILRSLDPLPSPIPFQQFVLLLGLFIGSVVLLSIIAFIVYRRYTIIPSTS